MRPKKRLAKPVTFLAVIGKLKLVLTGAMVALTAVSFGWVDSGHMVVATIAYGRLTPAAKAQADELLKTGGTDRTNDFVTAACWADDIRRDRRETGHWHYIDIHFRQDGKPDTNKPDPENAVWALDKFEKILADKSAPASDRADALRFVLHFVGDVHQPLHATSRDSDAMPGGDAGGNRFTIQAPDIYAGDPRPPHNLHVIWDLGCGFLPSTRMSDRPLNAETRQEMQQLASQVEAAHPFSSLPQARNLDPMTWAKESFQEDVKFVYSLPEGSKPTDTYMAEGQKICKLRLALAGYRLAEVLNKILS